MGYEYWSPERRLMEAEKEERRRIKERANENKNYVETATGTSVIVLKWKVKKGGKIVGAILENATSGERKYASKSQLAKLNIINAEIDEKGDIVQKRMSTIKWDECDEYLYGHRGYGACGNLYLH